MANETFAFNGQEIRAGNHLSTISAAADALVDGLPTATQPLKALLMIAMDWAKEL